MISVTFLEAGSVEAEFFERVSESFRSLQESSEDWNEASSDPVPRTSECVCDGSGLVPEERPWWGDVAIEWMTCDCVRYEGDDR